MPILITKRKARQWLIAAFVICLINLQTSLFGRLFNELFLLVPMVGILALLFVLERRFFVNGSKFAVSLISSMFAFWALFQVILLSPSDLYQIVAILSSFMISMIGVAFFVKTTETELILKTLIGVVTVLSISQLLTYVLLLVGLSDLAFVTEINPERFGAEMIAPIRIYVPFTFTVHFVQIFGVRFERATGLWREPGLYQMFVIISYFALDFVKMKRKRVLQLLFLFSLLTIFSTAGYVVFLFCLLYQRVLIAKRRYWVRFILLGLILVLFVLLFNAPFIFGLRTKLEINEKRLNNPLVSFELLMERPLIGYSVVAEGGINLLSSVHKLGIIGLILYGGVVLLALLQHYSLRSFVLILPVIITATIAQPIYLAGFVQLMLFLPLKRLNRFERPSSKEGNQKTSPGLEVSHE